MARTNAENQAAYRARRDDRGKCGEVRLDTWLDRIAAMKLERISRHYGITRRAALERLLTEEDDRICDAFDTGEESQAYLDPDYRVSLPGK